MTQGRESAPLPIYKWLGGLTCLLAIFMEVLDTSVANVALSNIQGSFAAGTDEITWVITSYLVANAVILPMAGWLGNCFGRKRHFNPDGAIRRVPHG